MHINTLHNTISNAQANKPGATREPKPEQHSRVKQSQSIQDGVHFSAEALEMAAVDPNVCKNDWRCLQSLDLRGLLR
ncbi:hypothetical protein JST97_23390 [bacterium]|nr:hypothetical protein [bacterium]